ncbi:MAG: SDR family oxidoreductase [Planctomycetota bacterium]
MASDPECVMGKVFLVVGATGGIGTALSNRLAADGASLVLAARQEEPLQQLATRLGAVPVMGDATQPDDVQRMIDTAANRFDRLDGVVHLPGSLLLKPAHRTTDEEWQHTIATNLTSAFNVIRAAIPRLRSAGGSIVLISSGAAQLGLANHEAIAAAKAGLIGLAKSAAASYARNGIRVNTVAPGLVQTGLTASLTANDLSARASEALHPLGRLGEPEDVASAVAWFLHPAQQWVTGQVLGVDGGLASLKVRAS